jgi:Fatty acid desaturase
VQALHDTPRHSLIDDQSRTYAEFRRALTPHWLRITLDLALAFSALGGTALLLALGIAHVPQAWPAWIALGAVSFGYWMAYLQLFIHEAAHFNLAPDRIWNDRLANLLIGIWVGARIEHYRAIHWQHHRLHGMTGDTEHSYFASLNARFLIESLFGIQALRVLLFRDKTLAGKANSNAPAPGGRLLMLAAAVALHLALIAAALASGHWQIAAAWVLGMGMFFPFFGALRQLLEHRGESARADVDYSKVDHGQTTRMFQEGLFASTFGGAGFTRHCLHHWDPSVSYTNLADVERFLARCEATRDISRQKTTYWCAFVTLYGR